MQRGGRGTGNLAEFSPPSLPIFAGGCDGEIAKDQVLTGGSLSILPMGARSFASFALIRPELCKSSGASAPCIGPSIRSLLPSVLRNSAYRDAEPIRKSKLRNHGAVYQTRHGSRLSLAPCWNYGERHCEREPFPLARLSGHRKHISSCSWTSWVTS
jgi:hypothetical protein